MGLRYVLLLLLLAATGCGSGAAQSASPRLFLAGDGELWVVDPAEAHVRHMAMPELGPGDAHHRVLGRGDRVVLLGETPFAADRGLAVRRPLAQAGTYFLPAARPDRVWIVEAVPGRWLVRAVHEVALDGTVTVDDAQPLGGHWPLAAVRGGLLIDDRGGGLVLWDPVARAVVRRLDIDPAGLGPASGDLVAFCSDEPCGALRLTDTRTGAARSVPAPPGTAFEPWAAAFSPDGSRLGIAVREPGDMNAPRRLALVDVEDGDVDLVRNASVPSGYVFVVWSSSGDHVYITGGERFAPRTLIGYRLGTWRANPIDVALGDFYGAAAL